MSDAGDAEGTLIEKSAGGGVLSREAFGALLSRHYGELCVIARAMGGHDDAEDIVQHAVIVAAERLERFEVGTDFRAWMAAIVRGVGRNTLRSRKRRRLRLRRYGEMLRDEADVSADDAVDGVDIERLRNAMAGLGHLESGCLLLRSAYGYSYREIGEAVGIPEATARSHVYRARRRVLEAVSQDSAEVR